MKALRSTSELQVDNISKIMSVFNASSGQDGVLSLLAVLSLAAAMTRSGVVNATAKD